MRFLYRVRASWSLKHCAACVPVRLLHDSTSSANSLNAARLYSLQTYHKKLQGKPHEAGTCRRIELEAWRHLQAVKDDDVDNGNAEDLAELLTSWVYFSKHWENGMNGPHLTSSDRMETAPLMVPSATREKGIPRKKITSENVTLPPRANPLDEKSISDIPLLFGSPAYHREMQVVLFFLLILISLHFQCLFSLFLFCIALLGLLLLGLFIFCCFS
eukprot:gene5958-4267_t